MLRSTTRLRTKGVILLVLCGTALADPHRIDLPSGKPGIGFDDLNYSPRLKRVLAPAGRSGNLALIDPASRKVTVIGGFSS